MRFFLCNDVRITWPGVTSTWPRESFTLAVDTSQFIQCECRCRRWLNYTTSVILSLPREICIRIYVVELVPKLYVSNKIRYYSTNFTPINLNSTYIRPVLYNQNIYLQIIQLKNCWYSIYLKTSLIKNL